jgi:hypothetical protein
VTDAAPRSLGHDGTTVLDPPGLLGGRADRAPSARISQALPGPKPRSRMDLRPSRQMGNALADLPRTTDP